MSKSFNCCSDLTEALTVPEDSLFRIEDYGVLFLTTGYTQDLKGIEWFQRAVIFCPFCGQELQDRDKIAVSSQSVILPTPIN
jgi:hypothetical protein